MTIDLTKEENEVMGPIAYLVVEFPNNEKLTGEGFKQLVDLVDRGLIRVIDLAFVTKNADGSVTAADIADFDGDGELDLAVFEGAASGLLDSDDIAESGGVIGAGSSAAILVYENRWAAPFAAAMRKSGGDLVAAGFIPQDALVASLTGAEATVSR